jgi:D-aminopeptidase
MTSVMSNAAARPRAREIGVRIGLLPTGAGNAITDVEGVLVGQTTVSWGDGPLTPGHGPARTGVTVVLPHPGSLFQDKVPAAIHVINGFGKTTGLVQVDELGTIESPIALTSTLCVGRVADALVTHAMANNPEIGVTTGTFNPIVGECSDAFLNDIQGRHVHEEHVLAAIASARSGPVAEGAVGAGTGMMAFQFKGGIGTASRVTPAELGGWTVGALVLANFGQRRHLVIDGTPVGRALADWTEETPERGSIMIVIATDAPLLDRGLKRIAKRAGLGLARTGSMGGHGSGDVVIAFSTAPTVRIPHEAPARTLTVEIVAENGPAGSASTIDALFSATVEATEEAIVNALFAAATTVGRDGNTGEGLPIDAVRKILASRGRLASH